MQRSPLLASTLFLLIALLTMPALFAQAPSVNDINPADVERVLIPLAFGGTVPGAYGSAWTMEFNGRNDGDVPLRFKDREPFSQCPTLCPSQVYPAHSSFSLTFNPILLSNGIALGALYYFPREDSASLHANLRIRDVSRALSTWGTEIPLIRDTAALTRGTSLFPIPTDSHFRATLRVYDFFPAGDSAVRIRSYSMVNDTLLGETVLNVHSGAAGLDLYPSRPGFGQITNLIDQFPAAYNTGTVRLEIQPLTPNLRYWAFVSVTNNDTQHITTITPQ